MKEQLIDLETAKLAKEKGFNIECGDYYNQKDKKIHNVIERDYNAIIYKNAKDYEKCEYYSAPTQALLQKWLREEHNIHIKIKEVFYDADWHIGWKYSLASLKDNRDHKNKISLVKFETYEEALEKGLEEALKLIET